MGSYIGASRAQAMLSLYMVAQLETSGNLRLRCAKITSPPMSMTRCPVCDQSIPEDARFCGVCGHQTTAVPLHDPMVGTTIAGRYRVLRVIAEGGMGIVYEALQPMGEGSRKVAIKTLLPELSRDPVVVSRFHRECGVVAGLEHPNTVRVYDFGTAENGTLYIAMEFVQGRSLGDVIADGPMPLQRCLTITEQVCAALEEAHNQGIVHRDLKPDNLVLSDRSGMQDFVKVLDFGIAKRSSTGGRHETKLTQQGMVLGTPPYMSPEQFSGEAIDRASDVYSLAVICFEMLNAKLPFEGDTPWQWAHMHMSVAPAAFTVAVPIEVQQVIYQALSKIASARPASALEFYRRLAAASVHHLGRASRLGVQTPAVPASPGAALGPNVPVGAPSFVQRTQSTMHHPEAAPITLDVAGDASLVTARTAAFAPAISARQGSGPMASGGTYSPEATEPSAQPGALHAASPRSEVRLPTGTEPSAYRIASSVATSAVLPAPPRIKRRNRRAFWATSIAIAVVGVVGIGLALWAGFQRDAATVPPVPTLAQTSGITTEIAGESPPVAATSDVVTPPSHAPVHNHGVVVPSTVRPSTGIAPAPTTHTPPSPVPTAVAQPQFPFPFPIALPSALMPPGLPPVVVASPTSTVTSAPTPSPLPPAQTATTTPLPAPAPNTPAAAASGLQICERAASLADTDLDAAVAQYQTCEATVGRTAAGAAKAKIAMTGVARAAALAAQGRCNEAEQVAQTLSRIGAQRPAHNAMVKAGCRV